MDITKTFKSANIKLHPERLYFSPDWIVLGVNNICNLHCKMCDVGTKNLESNFAQNLVGTHPINMPIDLIKKVIDEVCQTFPASKLAYAFTEALVYPHLIESLNYAQSKGIFTSMTTNALMLKQKAKALSESGLNEIFVSLDGPQDIHNKIRGNSKSFQKAIDGILELGSQSYVPKISIICAITEWNIGKLSELLDSLRGLPINDVGFMHTQFVTSKAAQMHNASPWGDFYHAIDSNMHEINLNKLDLELLLNEIHQIRSQDRPFKVYFSPEIISEKMLQSYYLQPEKILGKLCMAAFTSIMIKSDGSVIPAHGRCYNLTIGNIYKQSLKQIWNSESVSQFRSNLIKAGGLFPACARCCSGI